MTAYATIDQVEAGFRSLDEGERAVCQRLLEEAGVLIDAAAAGAGADAKEVASCRMVRRALGGGDALQIPMGATQGAMTAGPYTGSWTMSGGTSGELYLGKTERTILGVSNRIGTYSPVEGLVRRDD